MALVVGVTLGPVPTLVRAQETEPGNNTSIGADPIVVPGIPKGQLSAQINPAGDVDFFSVQARAGDLLYVLTSGADLVLTLFGPGQTGPACTQVALPPPPFFFPGGTPTPDCLLQVNNVRESGDVSTDSFVFPLPADGTYFVQAAHSSASGTGTYTIRAEILKESVIATGAGPGGGPHVRGFEGADGLPRMDAFAYAPAFTGGVHVATCDLNGDHFPDIVTGAGPGGGPHVRVLNGLTGDQIPGPLGTFFAYGPGFTGGVFVACADVNGDGRADIVTGAGAGGGPHVQVFDGLTGAVIHSFFAYDPAFTGGVFVAAGDVTGDGLADIVSGAGPGGGPHVKVFDGGNLALIHSFFAYDPAFAGGVFVAAGDVTGDGLADIVTGAGAGGGPHVKVFDGGNLALIRSFLAYAAGFAGGVSVGTGDVNNDGTAEIVTGSGPGGGPHVRVLDGGTLASLHEFFAYHPAFTGGVAIGGN